MRSARHGQNTSVPEVTNVSQHGLWLLIDAEELFVPFDHFPWFRNASIAAVMNVQRPSPDHLRWPDLDVDLTVQSIRHPEDFPLMSRGGSGS